MKSYYRGPIASSITVHYHSSNDEGAVALAAHEAAHVIVGHVLGCRVNSVEARGLDGLARIEADGVSLRNRLAIIAAGDVAARKIKPNSVTALRDEDEALALSADPAARKAAREQAARLVDQHWALIVRLARELRQSGGFMSGDALTRMLPARRETATRSSWSVATSYAAPRVRSRVGGYIG
jgi:hypothetical protein